METPNHDGEHECECGKLFTTLDKLKHHRRYYCRPLQDDDDVCKICNRTFKSYAGVRQHMRRAHPADYNEGLQGEDRRRYRPWAAMENLALVRAELSYDGYNVNQHLAALFPDRTLEMIKSHRRSQEYKALRDRVRAEIEETAEDGPLGDPPVNISSSPSEEVIVDEVFSHNMSAEILYPGPPDDPNNISLHRLVSPPVSPPPDQNSPTETIIQQPPADPIKDFIINYITGIVLDATWVLPIEFILDPTSTVEQIQGSLDRLWSLTVGVGSNNAARVNRAGPRPPPRLDNRKRRYAYVQHLYKTDRSRLAEGLLSGTLYNCSSPTFTAADAKNAYDLIFGALSPPDEEFVADPVDHTIDLYQPITADELGKFLNARQSDAKGPDGISVTDLRRVALSKLVVLFNLILFSSTIPNDWRLNRTILIPKSGGGGADMDAWRPLTVSSAALRVFNKILAARFSKLPLCCEQRGFRSMDGTLANTLTLQTVIKSCRSKAKPFSISTLDLRKAFDTVSHHSIIRAMHRFQLHHKMINLISDNYRNCVTKISIGGEVSDSIRINRGVKQGDPLSPILFNLVMDEAIKHLHDIGTGLSINGQRIGCMAYADDLVVFAEGRSDMQRALRILERSLSKRGMSFNAKKCTNLTCALLPSKSKLYVSTRSTLVINGGLIGQIGVEDQFRYLGFNYGFMGARVSRLEELPDQLQRLIVAPLKPQQKLNILKYYLIPRYMYLLQNPDITLKTLSSVDRQIRLSAKKFLHLPQQTTNAVLYTPAKQGGLGIVSFRSRIPGILLSRIESLLAKNDSDAVLVSTLSTDYVVNLREKLHRWGQPCGLKPEQVASFWASRLESSISGGGIWQVGAQGGSGRLIDSPPHWWSGEDYIKAVQLRYNLLPTKGGIHNRSGDTACRAGCARRETLCHILQACPITHHQRVRRHNIIVDKLQHIASARGITVEKEPRIRDRTGALHVPDLLFRKDNTVWVTDVAIHWEGPDTLAVSCNNKIARYSGPSFLEAVSARHPDSNIIVSPFIMGARGGWCPSNNVITQLLRMTRTQVDLVSSSVVKGGWIIHSSFSARIWADPGR